MSAFRSIRLAILAALTALSTGCFDFDDREIVAPPAEPSLSPSTQWAGGVVRVTLDGIEAGDTAPGLSLDDERLEVVAVGDGWVDYRLPTTERGDVTLELRGDRPRTFEVRVLGFRSANPLGLGLRGNLFVWPRVGPPSLLAVRSGGVVQILPGSLGVRTLVEDPAVYWGSDVRSVAPTPDPNRFILLRSEITNVFPNDQWAEVWSMLPAPQVIDTLPVPLDRHAMLLSDSVYVWSSHHTIASYDPRDGSPLYMALYEETQGAVVSPSGRYGAFRVNGSELGPPVFSSERGEPVFHVDTLFRSYGVDFSPVGDTLYIAGIRRAAPLEHLVLAYDATTGQLVDGLELGELQPLNLIRDPFSRWLYVMAGQNSAPPVLLVIDTRTMEIAGMVATSAAYLGCMGGCEGAVATGLGGTYFVTSSLNAAPSVVLAFDGWPIN